MTEEDTFTEIAKNGLGVLMSSSSGTELALKREPALIPWKEIPSDEVSKTCDGKDAKIAKESMNNGEKSGGTSDYRVVVALEFMRLGSEMTEIMLVRWCMFTQTDVIVEAIPGNKIIH